MTTPTEADRHHTADEYTAALAREYEDAPDDDLTSPPPPGDPHG